VTIAATATVLQGLEVLQAQGLSSLPVVDSTGFFLGALTHSHIKHVLTKRMYSGLSKSCAALLKEEQKINPDESDPLFACVGADSTLHDCIKRAVGHHYKRLYVLDVDGKTPIGVVSLSDMLRALFV